MARTRTLALAATAVATLLAAAAPAARAGSGADLIRFMPEDSTAFVAINVAGARRAPLFQEGLAQLVAMAPTAFAEAKAVGIDPATAIDTIAFGGRFERGRDSQTFVIVLEGAQTAAIGKVLGKDPEMKATTYHGVTYYANTEVAVFASARRLILAPPPQIQHAIDLALGKVKGAARATATAPLRAIVAVTDTRQDVWGAMVVPQELRAQTAQLGFDLSGFALGATLSADVALRLRLVTPAEADAGALKAAIDKGLPAALPQLDTLGLSAAAKTLQFDRDGAMVDGSVTITRAEITTLAAMVAVAWGGTHP